ncbi:MAG: AEC family transporter [Bacteroidota bacterium]|nr:AEC family transporter [Bacteroidota bacterium]MDP4192082.1 AEC family transporter [Bacteroidota bacterium]MDP4194777.1 AEC family transporter [Bacteroidota bacterium]
MENFILIFLLLLLGVVFGYLNLFPKDSALTLNLFVIYISLPALVLINIPKLTFSTDVLIPLILPWIMIAISVAIILILGKVFSWNRSIIGGLLLIVPLGNTSFLGIPMVKAYFGESHVPYAILYDQFGSFLALSTYGSAILAIYSGKGKPTINMIAKKVFTFPPFIALIAALLLRGVAFPPYAVKVLEMLASTLVPAVMFAVGLQIKLKISSSGFIPIASGLAIKLLIAPFFAILLCGLLGAKGQAVNVSIFEAGMGPMITAGALAIAADLEPEMMASMTGLGLILSFVTLPLVFLFL